jgi:hypothetical protein
LNIYLVVEGTGEKRVYTHWVPLVNPALTVVDHLTEVVVNNIVITSGHGFPQYLDIIRRGVLDVQASPHIDRLVIAVDSEDMSYSQKRTEIDQYVGSLSIQVNYRVIVQHFCLEAWALGNKVIVPRKPQGQKLRTYRQVFNVLTNDPELLPSYPPQELNRAQFATQYLRALVNEKYKGLTYTKSNPAVLLHDHYYQRVKDRFQTTGHIHSFNDFLSAFT